MYNPKSNTRLLLLLSSVATMRVEIQGENKQTRNSSQEKTSAAKRMVKEDFENYHICACIKKVHTSTFGSMVTPRGPHSVYTW